MSNVAALSGRYRRRAAPLARGGRVSGRWAWRSGAGGALEVGLGPNAYCSATSSGTGRSGTGRAGRAGAGLVDALPVAGPRAAV